ncbi:MAG: filamentous hemagglutinin N-terminal domain-containing protein [Aulosira sp. DedQUE10]|nr:filamentous hemagglutinin N-terminal domain-containing protein [Aulosira sp. DedQUE10]
MNQIHNWLQRNCDTKRSPKLCDRTIFQDGFARIFAMIIVRSQLIICSLILLSSTPAYSQINPDNTLGAESSRLTPNVLINGANADRIDGGAQRVSNLFHSFTQFNINDGQRVYFGNPSGVLNILTRVTGGQGSNILGTLGVDGIANLFLINPNGILFGQNARLDVRGSFVGTTANAVQFGNQGIFSATNPQAALLLTINPSALLFNQINQNAAIQNNSVAPAGKDPAGFDAFGLRVPDGKSLLLVGGNVSMDGGRLNAFGGRVELGGLAASGNINLLLNEDNLSLGFPENVNRANVSLTNQAAVFVEGASGGNIAVNSRNLEILGGSQLSAGIGQDLGIPETVAGDITLNATGEIKVADSESEISNLVRSGSKGNAGNITIVADSFSLQDGALLQASTYGQGNAGNVTVRSKDAVSLADAAILSTVEAGGVGKGGNIDIYAATLSLNDRAQLLTITREASDTQPAGRGDAGNVNVKVTSTVDIAGVKNGFPSAIISSADAGTVANGGNISIDSGSFSLRDGAVLTASTFGQGNAGNVFVQTKDSVTVIGKNTRINTGVQSRGVGKGGDINIRAKSLSIKDGAQLQSAIFSNSVTQSAGRGDAGNINIDVTDAITIAGLNQVPSGIYSLVSRGGIGNGGNITISAGSFSLLDGANVFANTNGQGDAGTIQINAADSVSISGASTTRGDSSEISARTNSLNRAGDIIINTRNFSLSNGAVVNSQTLNDGKGGNIIVNARRVDLINGGQFLSNTSGRGNAGKITVNANDQVTVNGIDATLSDRINRYAQQSVVTRGIINLGNGASGFYVLSLGSGITGDIEVNSPKITLDNSGRFIAESASGNGGNIKVNSDLLLLRHGSPISTNAGTGEKGGDGGNININSKFIVAVSNENSDISANAFSGRGGNVNISTQGIFGIAARPKPTNQSDITASSDLGVQGQITIAQPQVQPPQKLIELPTGLVDASTKFAQTCPRGPNAKPLSSFVVTGRGSLPPNSFEPLSGTTSLSPLASLDGESISNVSNASPTVNLPATSQIVEAQGLVKTADGNIMLVAEAPIATPAATSGSAVCPRSY